MQNKMCPKIDPWGTPQVREAEEKNRLSKVDGIFKNDYLPCIFSPFSYCHNVFYYVKLCKSTHIYKKNTRQSQNSVTFLTFQLIK